MDIKNYIQNNTDTLYKVLYDLCRIPAPSHFENARAQYCLNWFRENGIDCAYIDSAQNVIVPFREENRNDLTVICAHTDTVFPDKEPMPYLDDGEKIYCPGVGDDTASVAVLMLTIKYFFENNKKTNGILFVLNSCEEGLGNLKGTRQLFDDFKGRISKLVTFDAGNFSFVVDRCVGSHRYELEVTTQGGHSWNNFGNKNAIAELSKIVNDIYSIDLPALPDSKVSFNVGEISGGTSVNTIAQSAKALCEYRSDNVTLLTYMKDRFDRIFAKANTDGVKVNVKLIGERPCAKDLDQNKQNELKQTAAKVIEEITNTPVKYSSGSTDCNIPHSLGIPAIAVGVYLGKGSHTREEYIIKSSLPTGLEIGINVVTKVAEI